MEDRSGYDYFLEATKYKWKSQKAMAIDCGISRTFVSEIWRGTKRPGKNYLLKIVNGYGKPYEQIIADGKRLLGITPEPEKDKSMKETIESLAKLINRMDDDIKELKKDCAEIKKTVMEKMGASL
jgi:transcriptional regulator with XRE-family HTH domain